jgi:hypothetical protein
LIRIETASNSSQMGSALASLPGRDSGGISWSECDLQGRESSQFECSKSALESREKQPNVVRTAPGRGDHDLIVGEKRDLLFDTGMGISDLKKVIAELTSLPIVVLNSHTDGLGEESKSILNEINGEADEGSRRARRTGEES